MSMEPVAPAVRKIICRYTEGHPIKRVLHKGEDVLLVAEVIRISDAEARIADITKWRDEWKDMATELKGLVEEWQARAEAAEALLKEAREALEPFSCVVEHDISTGEDYRDVFRPMPGQYARAKRITVGHLRAARSIHHKIGVKDE